MGNVEENDLGFEKFMEELQDLYDKQLFSFGVFDDFPEEVIKAAVHEFGSDKNNIPDRRWLSSWFDHSRDDLIDLYMEACEEYLTSNKDKETIYSEYSVKARIMLLEFLEDDPLSPELSKVWKEQKDGPYKMFDQGDMVNAIEVRFSDDGAEGSDGESMAGGSGGGPSSPGGSPAPGNNNPSGPSRKTPRPVPGNNLGGRPTGVGFMRQAARLFRALSGPGLYEGYGFRKRPDAHQRFGGSERTRPSGTSGSRRLPSRRGTQGGRYPSISRVD